MFKRSLLTCLMLAACAGVDAAEPALKAIDGRTISLDQYRGRTVLLNIWATWCIPCLKEIPEIDQFAKTVDAKRVAVVGIAADEMAEVQTFIKKLNVSYPIAVGDPDQVFAWSEALGNATAGLPYSVILDINGKVVWTKSGGKLTAAELQNVMGKLSSAVKRRPEG
jgi:thiol-disulfide isomerase/thioredoxin